MTRSFVKVTCQFTLFNIVGYMEGPVEIATTAKVTRYSRKAADALRACQAAAMTAAYVAMEARLEYRKSMGLLHGRYNETWLRSYEISDTQSPGKIARSEEQGRGDGWAGPRCPWRYEDAKPRLWGKSKAARKQIARDDAAWAAKQAQWDAEEANTLTGVLQAAADLPWLQYDETADTLA